MVDTDLNQMDWEKLRDEVKKLRTAIRYHRDQKGDERCYLDDDQLYEVLPEVDITVERTLPCNFLENCKSFFENRQNRKYRSVDDLYAGWDKDKPYLSPVKMRTLIEILKQASDDMGNSSCNDMELENTDENWELVKGYLAHYGEDENPEHERPPLDYTLDVMDWMMCDYLIAELEELC